nr:IS110 family transposase [Bradyrhizobium yuanmingense]
MRIIGVNSAVAAGIVAAIGDISRFNSPPKLVSYFGLNPPVHQSGLGAAHHGRISKIGSSHARAMLVEAAWAAAKAPGPLHPFSYGSAPGAAIRSQRWPWRASSLCSARIC